MRKYKELRWCKLVELSFFVPPFGIGLCISLLLLEAAIKRIKVLRFVVTDYIIKMNISQTNDIDINNRKYR